MCGLCVPSEDMAMAGNNGLGSIDIDLCLRGNFHIVDL